MVIIDNPYPHEGAPGMLWIVHRFQHGVVIVTGGEAIYADIDQGDTPRVDLFQDILDQDRQPLPKGFHRIGSGALVANL